MRTALAVPLLKEGRLVGALTFHRRLVRAFSPEQIALLQTFADQAVIAIENVRLFKELEEKNAALAESLEQQTATGEILRSISSSPTDVQPDSTASSERAAPARRAHGHGAAGRPRRAPPGRDDGQQRGGRHRPRHVPAACHQSGPAWHAFTSEGRTSCATPPRSDRHRQHPPHGAAARLSEHGADADDPGRPGDRRHRGDARADGGFSPDEVDLLQYVRGPGGHRHRERAAVH
jgi:hypothetical protein